MTLISPESESPEHNVSLDSCLDIVAVNSPGCNSSLGAQLKRDCSTGLIRLLQGGEAIAKLRATQIRNVRDISVSRECNVFIEGIDEDGKDKIYKITPSYMFVADKETGVVHRYSGFWGPTRVEVGKSMVLYAAKSGLAYRWALIRNDMPTIEIPEVRKVTLIPREGSTPSLEGIPTYVLPKGKIPDSFFTTDNIRR